jgi:hypothetical protein
MKNKTGGKKTVRADGKQGNGERAWSRLGGMLREGFVLLPVVAAGALLQGGFAGCVGVHAPHETGRTAGGAVRCDKCRTIWVSRAEPIGKLTRYTREKAMICEDCESAVVHWMKTGDLRHYCSHCKGHMTCDPERTK